VVTDGQPRVQLLRLDPALGRGLSPRDLELARRHLIAPSVRLEKGSWDPDRSYPDPAHLGYLIIEGLMLREVEVDGARSLELLSSGDLIRPWLEDAASFAEARWKVIEPVRMAALDPPTAALAYRWPPLVGEIIDRGMRRSRSLALAAALENIRGIHRRLWVLFWHLAERWGTREPNGSILVPLRLTHEALAVLVGARRPTVTGALAPLAAKGLVTREPGRGWRLQGEPPGSA
jgi:CRP/FNR family cyclic AMP-dependent transcriptional regulator